MIEMELQTLNELKSRIQEQGTIKREYVKRNEDGSCSFCAVGHLLDIKGIDIGRIEESYNKVGIDNLPEDVILTLEEAGFAEDQLMDMQILNDNFNTNERRKQALVSFIDKRIDLIKDYTMDEEDSDVIQ
jgi:hypothetical protein